MSKHVECTFNLITSVFLILSSVVYEECISSFKTKARLGCIISLRPEFTGNNKPVQVSTS